MRTTTVGLIKPKFMKDQYRNQQSLFTQSDLSGLENLDSKPGAAPYLRGAYESMYAGKPWTIRQYTGFGSADETNRAFKKSLSEGASGLSVAFDLPTHLGFDSTDSRAIAEVGKTGVAIDSVDDMKQLFEGINLNDVSVSMTMNGAILPVLAAFLVAAQENGFNIGDLKGTIQNDILKEFMVRNTWIHAPTPSLKISTDIIEYLSHNAPLFNSQSISGYHFQEAGAEPALELALTLANAKIYLDNAQARNLNLNTFCHRLSFFFGVGMNFFDEIAKLRAARVLWSNEVIQRGGNAKAARMKIHCQTSGWSLAEQEPHNNLIRTTIEAMSAIFGGTQSLHTNAFDEALSIPTEESARLALNTQLILQEETGITDIVDPWGGSYFMESKTQQIINQTQQWLTRIEDNGGVIKALESGWIHQIIHQQALQTQADIDANRKPFIGVNRYQSDFKPTNIRKIDNKAIIQNKQKGIEALRLKRSDKHVTLALNDLTQAAQSGTRNLLELTMEAIRARATIGECTNAVLKVWPRYNPTVSFSSNQYGDLRSNESEWHRVKKKVLAVKKNHGKKPKILLCKLGLDGHDRGIKTVAAGLSDIGFDVTLTPLFLTPEDIVAQFLHDNYCALGISMLSGSHIELVSKVANKLVTNASFTQDTLPLFIGGIIPHEDDQLLKHAGVKSIFRPGTVIEAIADNIISDVASLSSLGDLRPYSRYETN